MPAALFIVTAEFAVVVEVFLIVRFLNEVVLFIACVVPLKITVLVLGVKVPLLVQSPWTVRVFDPEMVNVAPALMVISRQSPPETPIVG